MNYRFISIGILSIATFLTTTAKTTWIVENSTCNVDTLYHATVVSGTTLTELKVDLTIRYQQHVLHACGTLKPMGGNKSG